MDFEEPAHRALPQRTTGYMATGDDDDLTLKANREGFKHIQLRPRRLVDVTKTDLGVEFFGAAWDTPIFICPVGHQTMFHPEGELAVARAAKARRALQILSTVTTFSIEDVAEALGGAPWYQLYIPSRWEETEKMVRRVEAAGCPVLLSGSRFSRATEPKGHKKTPACRNQWLPGSHRSTGRFGGS